MRVKDRVSERRWYAQECTYHTIAYTGTETAVFVYWFCKTKATLNEPWLVSDHFQSPEGADVCPDWPQPLGVQLSTLGRRSLTSMHKPKPAERKWNKMSGGEQKSRHYRYYNCLNAVTHIKTSTNSNLEFIFMFCAHFLCAHCSILNWQKWLNLKLNNPCICWHWKKSTFWEKLTFLLEFVLCKYPPGQFVHGLNSNLRFRCVKEMKHALSVWGTMCKCIHDTRKQNCLPVCFIDYI